MSPAAVSQILRGESVGGALPRRAICIYGFTQPNWGARPHRWSLSARLGEGAPAEEEWTAPAGDSKRGGKGPLYVMPLHIAGKWGKKIAFTTILGGRVPYKE